MTTYALKERVRFKPLKGKVREGVVMPGFVDTGFVKVQLDGDPFPTNLRKNQISSCNPKRNVVSSKKKVPKSGAKKQGKDKKSMTTTATKPNAKELRKQAVALGVKGWEDMGRAELATAVRKAEKAERNGSEPDRPRTKASKPAKTKTTSKPKASTTKPKKAAKAAKATSKKAPAKKAKSTDASNDGITLAKGSTPKSLPEDGVNPFRKNSNLFRVAKLLLRGGVRRTLAQKLADEVDLHPYHKDAAEIDLLDYDKRLLLGAQTMRDQFGYGIQRVGRGLDGKILVFRPGGTKDPRKASKKSKK